MDWINWHLMWYAKSRCYHHHHHHHHYYYHYKKFVVIWLCPYTESYMKVFGNYQWPRFPWVIVSYVSDRTRRPLYHWWPWCWTQDFRVSEERHSRDCGMISYWNLNWGWGGSGKNGDLRCLKYISFTYMGWGRGMFAFFTKPSWMSLVRWNKQDSVLSQNASKSDRT